MEQRTLCRGDESILYSLERKKVKNINLRVDREGKIHVSAPMRASLITIERFLLLKFDWILSHTRYRTQFPHFDSPFSCKFVFYLGKRYPLALYQKSYTEIQISQHVLQVMTPIPDDKENVDIIIHKWYEQQAGLLLPVLYQKLAPRFFGERKLVPQLCLRSMSSTFGNYHHYKNRITLNKRLILMPEDCIEYVIFHEFCHTRIPNHGHDFYQLLRNFVKNEPEKKARINELFQMYGQLM